VAAVALAYPPAVRLVIAVVLLTPGGPAPSAVLEVGDRLVMRDRNALRCLERLAGLGPRASSLAHTSRVPWWT
jgi:hypothetical protein